DIAAGRLVYVPGANGNGAGYAGFTFQVQDDGGTANGGVDTDPTPNRITFDVAAVNDAPTVAIGGPLAVAEQGTISLKGMVAVADTDAGGGIVTAT
ncbi:hypothetical protein NQ354_25345, partial [Escherichia coli]|nr:hypothetical protein [Escherichia coli]